MLLPPGRNSQLGNKPPRDKAASYRETGFYHANEVAEMLVDSPSWTRTACEKRERKILDWAREEWGDVEVEPDDPEGPDPRLDSMIAEIMRDRTWTRQELLANVLHFKVFPSAKSPGYRELANMRTKRSILNALKNDYPGKFLEGFWPGDDESED